MMRKRFATIIILLIAVLVMTVSPILADDDKAKIGDKKALPTGDEATCIAETVDGAGVWQAIIGEPEYLPNTNIPYDCQWYLEKFKYYIAGVNTFDVEVDDKHIEITYEGKSSNWKPEVYIDGEKQTSTDPTLLPVDPINENYPNNTLVWDYGNGVKRYLRIIEGMLIEYYIVDYYVGGIAIENKVIKDSGFIYHRPANAWDADGEQIEVITNSDHDITIESSELVGVQYPIIIDPDTTFYTSSSDSSLIDYADSGVSAIASWNAVHDSVSAEWLYAGWTYLNPGVASYLSGGTYTSNVIRSTLYFDTSGLPAAVDTAILNLYGLGAPTTQISAFNLRIQEGMPTYPRDPTIKADFNRTYYAGAGGDLASANMGAGYKTITLTVAGEGWINLTGDTKFILREKEHDVDDLVPPVYTSPQRWNNWSFYSYEKGEGYRPYLYVTYLATAPAITTDAASNVAKTSARLNATVDDDGLESCQVRVGYGTTTQVVFANYDTVTAWSAAEWETGEHPFEDITGLNTDDDYFYRWQIQNSHSIVDSTEVSFHTLGAVAEPTNVRAYPSQTSTRLAWIKDEGATQTLVRYSSSEYPDGVGVGLFAYEGTASTYTLTGLAAGQTYWISLWGEADGVYSALYATVAVTTTAFAITDDAMESPVAFFGWTQDPDYTRMANTEPFYSFVNGVSDSMGVPRNTFWTLGAYILIACVAIGMMKATGFFAGFIVGCIGMQMGVTMGIVQSQWLVVYIILGIGIWVMNTRRAEG